MTSIQPTRENQLHQWLNRLFESTDYTIASLAGDASFRRYYRVNHHHKQYILMDAPPSQEKIEPFVKIAHHLKQQGLHVPSIFSADVSQGFILLEDFGDHILQDDLNLQTAEIYYKWAFYDLKRLASVEVPPDLPHFDEAHIRYELSLFTDWFLQKKLNIQLNPYQNKILDNLFALLISTIKKQPQVFVHLDFHSRNLMILPKQQFGILDFQDAKQGPITYDIVSLLKDCYVKWPRDKVILWLKEYYEHFIDQSKYSFSWTEFLHWFDLTGLQRHLKVIGIFCRLYLRDQKNRYLQDIPRVFSYIKEAAGLYPELNHFHQLLEDLKIEKLIQQTQSEPMPS